MSKLLKTMKKSIDKTLSLDNNIAYWYNHNGEVIIDHTIISDDIILGVTAESKFFELGLGLQGVLVMNERVTPTNL